MRNICIFTSTRADWGQLRGLAKEIQETSGLRLLILVTGAHLSPAFGMTIAEVEADGFAVNGRFDIMKYADTPTGICKTMARALDGYGEILHQLNPDILVLLGDRYETFCAAAAAHILRIPMAHIHGGETTEGAVDEAFRHAITKMAQLHFASCEQYRRRIIQLGENPHRVFAVGALAIENIRKLELMDKDHLATSIGFPMDRPFFLVTFHPPAAEIATAGWQFEELVSALARFPEHRILFTKANADAEGQIINAKIDTLACSDPDRILGVHSLGLRRYLSAMKLCDAVIGNSSSGLLEAPVLQIPTVNIGNRQKGRIRTASVIDCEPEKNAIAVAIRSALDEAFRAGLIQITHPCEKSNTALAIRHVLESISLNGLLMKSFYDIGG